MNTNWYLILYFITLITKLMKLFLQNFELSPDGKIIATCGRFGNIFLLCAKTKEFIGSLKTNSDVNAICFSKDGSILYSHGGELLLEKL